MLYATSGNMMATLGPFELYEVLLLLLLLIGLVPLTLQYLQHRNTWFYAAYIAFFIGSVATVLEHIMFYTVLNLVEHTVGIMLAGFLFWLTAMFSADDVVDEKHNESWREVLQL